MPTQTERVEITRNPSLPALIPTASWIAVETQGNGSSLIPATGREGMIVWNPTAGSLSFTVNHAPNYQGRVFVGTVNGTRRTIVSGGFYWFGPFPVGGFMGSNGMITVYGSAAGLLLAVLDIPDNFYVMV